MALNTSPLREITQEDIDTYNRDGAVCIRKVLNQEWVDILLEQAREVIVEKKDVGLLPTIPGRYMARCLPDYRKLMFEGPVAEAAGKVLQSKEIRFFFDEFFAKPPQSDAATLWHCDRMAFPVEGKLVPFPTADELEFSEPGDMLVVHPWVLHYSAGNPTDDWRVAISERVFGDDIRWAPRPDCLNIAGVSFDEMLDGEKPEGPLFPLLWSQDGRKEDDSEYPRGFATRWPKRDMGGVNEYDTFKKMKEKEDAGELSVSEKSPDHKKVGAH